MATKKAAAKKAAPAKSPKQKEIAQAKAVAKKQNWKPARLQRKITAITAKYDKATYKQSVSNSLNSNYKIAQSIINSNPELKAIFDQGVKEGITADVLFSRIQSSTWYQNSNQAYRNAQYLESSSPGDWKFAIDAKKREIAAAAGKVGAKLSDWQLTELARTAIYGGFDESQIDASVVDYIDFDGEDPVGGKAREVGAELRTFAANNGVKMTEEFYATAVRAALRGEGGIDPYIQEIKTQAAGMYPAWADKLQDPNSVLTVRDLANGYITSMKNMLDLSDNDISLDNPILNKALKAGTPNGDPAIMPLWQFEKEVRSSDQWKTSKAGQQVVTEAMNGIVQKMGF